MDSDGCIRKPNRQELSHDELLNLVERAICLLGNAANSISALRRSKILYAINSAKIFLAEAAFPNTGKKLFGNDITKIAADSAKIVRNLQKTLNQQHSQTPSWSAPPLGKYQAKNENRYFHQAKNRFQDQQQPFLKQTKERLPLTGRLPYFMANRLNITQDPIILQIVQGFQIPFQSFPVQRTLPPPPLSLQNCRFVGEEIETLLRKGAIERVPFRE